MDILALLGIALLLAFGLVVFVGPPYLPTLDKNTEAALDLLALKPGQTLLELGSGDGKVILAAAKRGIHVIGIELNPVLLLVTWLRCWKYRSQITLIWGNYWHRRWPDAASVDGVFTFMLPRLMTKLDGRMEEWCVRPTRLASFAFVIPGKKLAGEKAGVYLYEYK